MLHPYYQDRRQMVPMRIFKVRGKEVRIRACGLKLTDLHLQIGCPSYHRENHL